MLPSDFILKSEKVLEKLEKLSVWKDAETVLIFLSLSDEIKTDIIINKALSSGKKTAVPRINNNNLEFHIIESLDAEFITHHLGMDEPDDTFARINTETLRKENTLILVPRTCLRQKLLPSWKRKRFLRPFPLLFR